MEKVKVLVAQYSPTLCDPMDCSPSGFSAHGILQARILEWVAISFFRGSSPPRDQSLFSCISGRFFTIWVTREAQFSSLQFSYSVVSDSATPWTIACQASLSINNSQSLLKLMPIESVMPSNHLVICCPLLLLLSIPESGSFPMSQFFTSGGQSIGVSASGSVHPMDIQDWFPSGLTVWSPCNPRDSQESSPTPQFKSINSLALSFLYSPTLTFIHDYWKNHSFD